MSLGEALHKTFCSNSHKKYTMLGFLKLRVHKLVKAFLHFYLTLNSLLILQSFCVVTSTISDAILKRSKLSEWEYVQNRFNEFYLIEWQVHTQTPPHSIYLYDYLSRIIGRKPKYANFHDSLLATPYTVIYTISKCTGPSYNCVDTTFSREVNTNKGLFDQVKGKQLNSCAPITQNHNYFGFDLPQNALYEIFNNSWVSWTDHFVGLYHAQLWRVTLFV